MFVALDQSARDLRRLALFVPPFARCRAEPTPPLSMSATFAPSPWPSPGPAATGRRFGREVATRDGHGPALQWTIRRPCSITPRQLAAVYLLLCALSVAVSVTFWMLGARIVAAFAGVEMLAVGAALLVHARHAFDGDVMTLTGRRLAVEQRRGGRTAHASFDAHWAVVEPLAGQASLLQIRAHGSAVCVGRFMRPELRAAFAQELRRELRHAALGAADRDPN